MNKLIEFFNDQEFSVYNYNIEELVSILYGELPSDPFSTMFFKIYQLHIKSDSNLTKQTLLLKIKAYASMNNLKLVDSVRNYIESSYIKEEDLYIVESVKLMGVTSSSRKLRTDVDLELNTLLGIFLDISS